MNKTILKVATLGLIAASVAAPSIASADWRGSRSHREQQKDTWKNLAIGSAVVGLYGLAKGDRDLTILGAAGAVYSGYRYDQDGKGRWYGRDRYDRYDRDDRYDRYSRYDRDRYDRHDRWDDRRDHDRHGRW